MVGALTNSQEYKLAKVKSTSTPYKVSKRMVNDLSWQKNKWKLEEVFSQIATEVHAASDLHKKQWPDETLQEYIQHFTDLVEKAMWADPANIKNRVIIFLFMKKLYNCDIQKDIAGAKTIYTLADTFRLAHQSLLKIKNVRRSIIQWRPWSIINATTYRHTQT